MCPQCRLARGLSVADSSGLKIVGPSRVGDWDSGSNRSRASSGLVASARVIWSQLCPFRRAAPGLVGEAGKQGDGGQVVTEPGAAALRRLPSCSHQTIRIKPKSIKITQPIAPISGITCRTLVVGDRCNCFFIEMSLP